jgi:hypothetical protein
VQSDNATYFATEPYAQAHLACGNRTLLADVHGGFRGAGAALATQLRRRPVLRDRAPQSLSPPVAPPLT